jgi:phosphatidylserine/phosphatidylglycerophosphate/cardiolipin synthase-like enzyme
LQELSRRVRQARPGGQVTVMSMVLEPSIPDVIDLLNALCDAAVRGVRVTLIIDGFSFLLSEESRFGPLFRTGRIDPNRLQPPFDETYGLLERLRVSGGNYFIVNMPDRARTNPFSGRSHIKMGVVDDFVMLGGCNLDKMEYTDVMAGWQDARLADWLRGLTGRISRAGSVRQALGGQDVSHTVNAKTSLFVDSGVRGHSLIMQQAHALIDSARELVTITCQYFPGGATGQRLLAAHRRGVKVTIHFSPPAAHGVLKPAHWLHNIRERSRLPSSFFAGQLPAGIPKLHAKVIVTESAAMLGSHNYVQAGVRFGTAEIALLRRDPEFARALIAKVEGQLTTS